MPTQKSSSTKPALKLKKKEKDLKKKKPLAKEAKDAKGVKAGAKAPPNGQAAIDATAAAKEKLKKLGKGTTEAKEGDVDPEELADEQAAAADVDPDAVEEAVE